MSKTDIPPYRHGTGYFTLLSSLDVSYARGIIDTNFWRRPKPPYPSIETLGKTLPIVLTYYYYHPRTGYILTMHDICWLYRLHTQYLSILFKKRHISKAGHLVSQDILDRFFLNMFIRLERSRSHDSRLLQDIRDAITERWKPVYYKIIKKKYDHRRGISKEEQTTHPMLLSEAIYEILARLDRITDIKFFNDQEKKWALHASKVIYKETVKPLLRVYPYFVGNLLSQQKHTSAKSVYADQMPLSADGESELLPAGYKTVITDNDTLETVRIHRDHHRLKPRSQKYPSKVIVERKNTGGLKSPLNNTWIIPPKPLKTPYVHINAVSEDFGYSQRQIRRYIKEGALEGAYFRVKGIDGKLLYIKQSSLSSLSYRINWKSWIKGVALLQDMSGKRASNRIRYWISKKIREEGFFYNNRFTKKECENIEKDYLVNRYKRGT